MVARQPRTVGRRLTAAGLQATAADLMAGLPRPMAVEERHRTEEAEQLPLTVAEAVTRAGPAVAGDMRPPEAGVIVAAAAEEATVVADITEPCSHRTFKTPPSGGVFFRVAVAIF